MDYWGVIDGGGSYTFPTRVRGRCSSSLFKMILGERKSSALSSLGNSFYSCTFQTLWHDYIRTEMVFKLALFRCFLLQG